MAGVRTIRHETEHSTFTIFFFFFSFLNGGGIKILRPSNLRAVVLGLIEWRELIGRMRTGFLFKILGTEDVCFHFLFLSCSSSSSKIWPQTILLQRIIKSGSCSEIVSWSLVSEFELISYCYQNLSDIFFCVFFDQRQSVSKSIKTVQMLFMTLLRIYINNSDIW